ncbi:hypothetical protein OG735_00490 [Streptomyces sp. NBC_01210]|uniref:hypothetical protein n=1 Tax=Streptomyces sp. NBC_01210 TaxID=2903774 RepID=UPI002E1034F2|nr:hypothetical protein OG735_00490 [Streptomyces sp. NBC_01210]
MTDTPRLRGPSAPSASRRAWLRGALLGGAALAVAAPPVGAALLRRAAVPAPFRPTFPRSGLVTNEYAHWNPDGVGARLSDVWDMTSGSVFADDGAAWSGVPDSRTPNANCTNGNNSCVFRLASQRHDFENTVVTLQMRLDALVTTPRTPALAWDGLHIWLRYHDETELYAVSVARRDGVCVIKRKNPPGNENGGTYYEIGSTARNVFPYNTWVDVRTSIATQSNHTVRLTLDVGGRRVLDVVDTKPMNLLLAGGVGVRGDNADFQFRNLVAISS